jgi:hypothetical protein
VDLTLHDVFLIDKTEKKKYNRYDIPFGRDLNLQYQVTIERNPCFGMDTEIDGAQKALEGVSKSYASMKSKYGSGEVPSQPSLKIFEEMKSTVLGQFQKDSVHAQSPCPELQTTWSQYNQYVDSIAAMKVVVVDPNKDGGNHGISPEDIKILLIKSRQIDLSVSRWLVTTDPVQREDIIKEIQNNIKTGTELLGGRHGVTAEQKQAIATFRAAEQYFNKTCLRKQ